MVLVVFCFVKPALIRSIFSFPNFVYWISCTSLITFIEFVYVVFRWIVDPPLEITVPSKRTPWPDAPPELPSNEKVVVGVQEHTVKHSPKTRTPRSKRSSRSKRKHDTKIVDTQLPVRHSEQN